mgnify:CR=1 FL=1
MKDPVGKWHEEHMYFHRLLELLRHEVDQLALGETPNYALMLDIIDYLRDYSDHVHHPREDAVFRRLARYCPDRELPLARLAVKSDFFEVRGRMRLDDRVIEELALLERQGREVRTRQRVRVQRVLDSQAVR